MRSTSRAAALAMVAIFAGASTSVAAADTKAASGAASKSASVASGAAQTAAPASPPVEFEGTLESGRTYVADVAWDNNALHIWRPLKDVKVPSQHAWTIAWTNLAKFPALKTPATRARPQRFTFTVSGVDMSSGSPSMPWTTVYRCEVLAVDAVAVAVAPAAKRK